MAERKTRRVLIMAGGTGGHVFPALATADALRAQGIEVAWLGTAAGIEAEVVPRAGIPLHCIQVQGVRGKGRLRQLLAPLGILLALWQALGVFRQVRPDAVLGMGGFASGPGGLVAWLLRKPLVIHEQNAVAGTTNRILARVATRVLQAFPGAFGGEDRGLVVGNPVRGPILQLPTPEQRFAERQGPLRLLVVGGSLGARRSTDCCHRPWHNCRRSSVPWSGTRRANATLKRLGRPTRRWRSMPGWSPLSSAWMRPGAGPIW